MLCFSKLFFKHCLNLHTPIFIKYNMLEIDFNLLAFHNNLLMQYVFKKDYTYYNQ